MKYLKERDFVERCYRNIVERYLTKSARLKAVNYEKGEKDVVTDIDFEIEKYFIKELNQYFPKDNIISEEFNSNNVLQGRTWTIDPIDGTINFSRGSFIFGLQIALIENEKPVLSYIFIPELNNQYMAIDGEGAYLNDERIYINKNYKPDKAIISIGSFSHKFEQLKDYEFELLKLLQEKVMGIRLFGSSAFDCATVASSMVQAHFMFALNLWDVAPGALLCKEAGAIVTKIDGSEFQISCPSYLFSSNAQITELFVESVKKLPKIDFLKFKTVTE